MSEARAKRSRPARHRSFCSERTPHEMRGVAAHAGHPHNPLAPAPPGAHAAAAGASIARRMSSSATARDGGQSHWSSTQSTTLSSFPSHARAELGAGDVRNYALSWYDDIYHSRIIDATSLPLQHIVLDVRSQACVRAKASCLQQAAV
jgi:hypothetical protein